MGSPLGLLSSNFNVPIIIIEDVCIEFNSDIALKFYSWYVDDVYSVFINSDPLDDFLNPLNDVINPLIFTIEKR